MLALKGDTKELIPGVFEKFAAKDVKATETCRFPGGCVTTCMDTPARLPARLPPPLHMPPPP
jgi:hypothetical protein